MLVQNSQSNRFIFFICLLQVSLCVGMARKYASRVSGVVLPQVPSSIRYLKDQPSPHQLPSSYDDIKNVPVRVYEGQNFSVEHGQSLKHIFPEIEQDSAREQEWLRREQAFAWYQAKMVRTCKFVLGVSIGIFSVKKITNLVSSKYVEKILMESKIPGTLHHEIARVLKDKQWRELQRLLFIELDSFSEKCISSDVVTEDENIELTVFKKSMDLKEKIKYLSAFVKVQVTIQILSQYCRDAGIVLKDEDVAKFQEELTTRLYYIHIKWALTTSPASSSTISMIVKDLTHDMYDALRKR